MRCKVLEKREKCRSFMNLLCLDDLYYQEIDLKRLQNINRLPFVEKSVEK